MTMFRFGKWVVVGLAVCMLGAPVGEGGGGIPAGFAR